MNPSLDAALTRLPHGPEFRFLDRLTELQPGFSGKGEFTVRPDASFLKGHFPGEPLFPGVLLAEAAAQLAGTVAQSHPSLPPLRNLRLAALRMVKILGTARPGETIELEATITGRMGSLIQAQTSARIRGATVLQAEITLAGQTEL